MFPWRYTVPQMLENYGNGDEFPAFVANDGQRSYLVVRLHFLLALAQPHMKFSAKGAGQHRQTLSRMAAGVSFKLLGPCPTGI